MNIGPLTTKAHEPTSPHPDIILETPVATFILFQFTLGQYPRNVREYLRVLNALINKNVAFKVEDFTEKIRYLAGEIPFAINNRDEPDLPYASYFGSREEYGKYFHKIKWDQLQLPHFK